MKICDEFSNEVYDRLLCAFRGKNEGVLKEISGCISDDYYFTYASDELFLKIAACSNFHFSSLCNEINLGNITFEDKQLKPEMIFTYKSDKIVVKAEKRIDAAALGGERDDFSLKTTCDVDKLIKTINLISKVKLRADVTLLPYSRSEKILKYTDECEMYLKNAVAEKCRKTAKEHIDNDLFFSHGDLIPSNILPVGNEFIFVDWEWAAFRSKTYDSALFLLFSDTPYIALSDFDKYFDTDCLLSAYLDAVVISLREIKNWKNEQVYVKDKENRIKMWLETLEQALGLVEKCSNTVWFC